MRHPMVAATVLAVCALPWLLGAGPSIVVKLPSGTRVQSATATAPTMKLSTIGQVQAETVTFANVLPDTAYDVQIVLTDGTVWQGADLSWYAPEASRADVKPLDDDDRQQIKELFDGIKGFENKRDLLLMAGDHDRVTILAQLIRDTEFHSDKGGEIIWRIELWYFKNQHGGWEKVPQENRVLRRERFTSREAFTKATKIKWVGELGGIRVGKEQKEKVVSVDSADGGTRMDDGR